MVSCEYCGREFKNRQVLSVHVFHKHPQAKPSISTEALNKKQNKAGGESITQEDINQILGQLSETIRETLKKVKVEEVQAAEQQVEENALNETLASIKDLAGKISSYEVKLSEIEKQVKTICELYPGLCGKVEALEKKLTERHIAVPEKKGHFFS